MRYLDGDEVAGLLSGVVSEKRQRHRYETDLTVQRIAGLTGPGAVDFGGSEERPAPVETRDPVKRAPSDSYGWWDLEAGMYLVTFNEVPRLAEEQVALIQPHERLVAAGAVHPTFYFRGIRETMNTVLTVGPAGISIKENARIAKLLVLDQR